MPGLGRVRLRNIAAVAPGQSPDVIVVMAHRDDVGTGPGANDNASGTAALIELARSFAQPETSSQRLPSPQTIVFLSTDAGTYGGLGAVHFLATSPFRKRIAAVIDLDAIGGHGPAEHRDRRRLAALPEPEPRRDDDRAGSPSRPAPRRGTSASSAS